MAFAGGFWINGALWQSKWDSHQTEDARANEKAALAALATQHKLIKDLENAQAQAKQMQDKHDRNVADARSANERLRVELDRIKALPKSVNSHTVAERANSATDRLVLAELLGESDARAGAYAEQADRNRQVAINCANEYNSLRGALSGI